MSMSASVPPERMLLPHVLKQFLDLGNDKFAAGTVDPGSDGGTQQQLVHGRYFSEDALQIRLIHSGISAQRREGCQSTIRSSHVGLYCRFSIEGTIPCTMKIWRIWKTGLRRLKVEYHIFLSGNRKKPPDDLRIRVERLVKKLSESSDMSFSQRFRFSTLVTRYYVYKDLWRREVQKREMD